MFTNVIFKYKITHDMAWLCFIRQKGVSPWWKLIGELDREQSGGTDLEMIKLLLSRFDYAKRDDTLLVSRRNIDPGGGEEVCVPVTFLRSMIPELTNKPIDKWVRIFPVCMGDE